MKLVNMKKLSSGQTAQAAQMLTDSLPLGWATYDEAMAEIEKRLVPENVLLAAVEEDGTVLGWGGILPLYNGNVREVHPLVVRADCRSKGTGRAIMLALEEEARKLGAHTMWLGADDEREPGETSFAGVDLYDNFPVLLKNFDPGTHQAAFYMKLGYTVVGAVPDANGPGKPDIYMAKRL